jgi:hypothetical protein
MAKGAVILLSAQICRQQVALAPFSESTLVVDGVVPSIIQKPSSTLCDLPGHRPAKFSTAPEVQGTQDVLSITVADQSG